MRERRASLPRQPLKQLAVDAAEAAVAENSDHAAAGRLRQVRDDDTTQR